MISLDCNSLESLQKKKKNHMMHSDEEGTSEVSLGGGIFEVSSPLIGRGIKMGWGMMRCERGAEHLGGATSAAARLPTYSEDQDGSAEPSLCWRGSGSNVMLFSLSLSHAYTHAH